MTKVTTNTIAQWIEEGKSLGYSHVMIVSDDFSYEYYPVFIKPTEHARSIFEEYNGKNMQRVMEVYNLSIDIGDQLNKKRALNF